MAFDKKEIKQLEELFEKSDTRTDERFKISEKSTDVKFQQYFSKSEKRTYEIVVQAIEEVVMPRFDNVDNEFIKIRKEMKAEFDNSDKRMDSKLAKLESKLMSKIEYEVAKLREEIRDIKSEIIQLKKMVDEDIEMALKENNRLAIKVDKLEERIRILELANK